MKKIIIGLGSRAQVGKDYAASELSKYLDVRRVAFADSLKDDLAYLFNKNGLSLNELLQVPELKAKIRPLLVSYGQTMRMFNEDIWVERALKNKELTSQVTIITDVRFPNEVAALKKLGGYYIDIQSNVPPANETEALFSPQMYDLADFRVTNNFDSKFVPALYDLIKTLIN